MRNRSGFTLIELMVVIIIIVIIAGSSVALLNVFFRGTGARQAATECVMAFAQAKQLAADQRRMYFLVFSNQPEGGIIEIHRDENKNRQYDGDTNPVTNDPDPAIDGSVVSLPKWIRFETFPQWVGVHPTGYCTFNSGYSEVGAGLFDAAAQAGTLPSPRGDIILGLPKDKDNPGAGLGYTCCLDIDRGAGKIRRWYFLNQ